MSDSNIHTDPTKRHDFVLLFDVTQGNPNGDPDAENMPRVDPETMHGIVTDVCLKRKVRDYVAGVLERDKEIFIQSKVALNRLILDGFREAGFEPAQVTLTDEEQADEELVARIESKNAEGFSLVENLVAFAGEKMTAQFISQKLIEGDDAQDFKARLRALAKRLGEATKGAKGGLGRETQDAARKQLCARYYDIRMFGAVLSTGLNAGQVRGPMQLTFARSFSPIVPLNLTITRQARTTSARMETGTTEMGRKSTVPYGLYKAHGFFSPFLAEKTRVSNSDLETFWEALERMFEHDHSASRGEMHTRGVYIFTHSNPKGDVASHRLFRFVEDRIRTSEPHPRSVEAYGQLPTQKEVEESARAIAPKIAVKVLGVE